MPLKIIALSVAGTYRGLEVALKELLLAFMQMNSQSGGSS